MKRQVQRIQVIFSLFSGVYLCSCSGPFQETKLPLSLSTLEPSAITSSSAQSGGKIFSDGGSAITARGVCWATFENPVKDSLNTTRDGSGSESFSSRLNNLLPNTQYFVRAWAENSNGIAYGNQVPFRTTGIDSLICSRTVNEGVLTAGMPASGVESRLFYQGRNPGGFPAMSFNSAGSVSGLTAVLDAGSFNADSGMLILRISGVPSRAGAAVFYLNIAGKKCTLIRQVGVADAEGNRYETQSIGNQVWMKENLRTLRYRNGDPIPTGLSDSVWASITYGACSLQGSSGNDTAFGLLYNWYAASDSRGLCPQGFHVPADAEWTILENFLGGRNAAGGKLKATGTVEAGDGFWLSPNTGASNSSGFSGLPAGYRNGSGRLLSQGQFAYWWAADSADDLHAWYRSLAFLNSNSNRNINDKRNGQSVRCIRD